MSAVFDFKAIARKPTQESLRRLFSYDPLSGDFICLISRRRARAGSVAGRIRPDGYRVISIYNKEHLAHRLAWVYMMGEWPDSEIDHKDRNKSNNSWDNLRLANSSQNKANCGVRPTNKIGLKGVKLIGKKYRAEIRINSKSKHLGTFLTPEEAHAAYVAAAKAHFGEFASAA